MGAAEIMLRLRIRETRLKYYLALPTWPATFDEPAAGRMWLTKDIEAWIAKYRPDLAEEPEGE